MGNDAKLWELMKCNGKQSGSMGNIEIVIFRHYDIFTDLQSISAIFIFSLFFFELFSSIELILTLIMIDKIRM